MADFDNKEKAGVDRPFWGSNVNPWQLDEPWTYENPTPIDYTNKTKNTSTFSNKSKSRTDVGRMLGFPVAITYPGTTDTPWTNKVKN